MAVLISCIMVTRGRPEWAPRSVDCWRRQTYRSTELVIIDDADDPSFLHAPTEADIRHVSLSDRRSIGAKRNIACELAAGSVIAVWDDDDWSAPERLADQIGRLDPANLTGYHSMRFTLGRDELWEYRGQPDYALGTSLMFRKDWWERNRFPDMQVQEDYSLVSAARAQNTLKSAPAGNLMTATIHPRNTSPRQLDKLPWRRIA